MSEPALMIVSQDGMNTKNRKPLGRRAYTSILHIPGSQVGRGDKVMDEGQARILTTKCRKGDTIVVQEKLDGSCVSIAKINGVIVPLIRAGYEAIASSKEQHRLFAAWVFERQGTFDFILEEGERLCGEWLAQAHGVRYDLSPPRQPFVPFDIMRPGEQYDDRATHEELIDRVHSEGFDTPALLHIGGAYPVEKALSALGSRGFYGAIEKPEGVVYRCETGGRVEFIGKYVRSDFVPGKHLPDVSGKPEVWNWRPQL